MIKALNNIANCRSLVLPVVMMALLSLTACKNPITNPAPPMLDMEIDQGPEEYRLGYKHGCESALAAYGNNMQKTFYTLQKDPRFYNNKMYNQIWKDAWNYCYMWIFVYRAPPGSSSMYGNPLF